MLISLVVAMSKSGVIGRDGKLPWKLPADMEHFKQLTMGNPIVMGRKTYESIGRALPGRQNIVVSRDESFRPSGVQVYDDLDLVLGKSFAGEELMVIGGADIYAVALPRASRIYLTEVQGHVDGNVYFPRLNRSEWYESSRSYVPRRGEATHDCSFVVLERRRR